MLSTYLVLVLKSFVLYLPFYNFDFFSFVSMLGGHINLEYMDDMTEAEFNINFIFYQNIRSNFD